MRRFIPAGTTIALAALLVAALHLGIFAVVAVLLVAVVVLASGWPTLLGLPTPRGSTTLLSTCGTVALLVQLFPQPDDGAPLAWLTPVLACSIVGAFMHQLLRRDMRPRLIDSVTGVVTGVVIVECAAGWVALASWEPNQAVVGACAVVGAALGLLAPGPVPVRATACLALSAAAAFGSAATFAPLSVPAALATGVLVAGLVYVFGYLFSTLPSATSRQAGMASAAAAICAVGMVVFLISDAGASFPS